MAKKKGRPEIEFNLEELEKLARLQCTQEEIASFFGCSIDTIQRRMKDDEEFCGAYKKGVDEGKMSLRRAQFKAALGGNVTMQIWLGKQYLGQSDKQEVDSAVTFNGPLVIERNGKRKDG